MNTFTLTKIALFCDGYLDWTLWGLAGLFEEGDIKQLMSDPQGDSSFCFPNRPDRDTFDFSLGHVTENQPMAVPVWLRESLGM